MLRPCNLACGGRGGSVARASDGSLDGGCGISGSVGGAFEWIPGQQARVVVALGRRLGVFIDDLCRYTLESTRFGLGRFALDAGLGLAVDEGGDWGEFGVVGVVDGLDPMLLLQLVRRQRRASDRRDRDAFRPGWLGGIHEWEKRRERNDVPCLELPLPLEPGVTELFQP